jgi:excisionase family DNA binding protein
MAASRYVGVAALAIYLGLTDNAVRGLVKRGQIPVTRVGRTLRFDLRKIDRWLEAHTTEVAS